jgi:hypothetical protein
MMSSGKLVVCFGSIVCRLPGSQRMTAVLILAARYSDDSGATYNVSRSNFTKMDEVCADLRRLETASL